MLHNIPQRICGGFMARLNKYGIGGLAAGGVVLVAALAAAWFLTGGTTSINALVGGEEQLLVATASGKVENIHIRPGDILQPGDTVLELDSAPQRAALEAAQTALDAFSRFLPAAPQTDEGTETPANASDDIAGAAVGALPDAAPDTPQNATPDTGRETAALADATDPAQRMAAARHAEDAAQALVRGLSVDLAQARYERRALSLRTPPPSPEAMAEALAREQAAEAALEQARLRAASASRYRADVNGSPGTPPYGALTSTAHAQGENASGHNGLASERVPESGPADGQVLVELRDALARKAEDAGRELDERTLRSGLGGEVRVVAVAKGANVESGAIVARLAPSRPEDIRIVALFPTEAAARLKPGMRADIELERPGGPRWKGVVLSVSETDGAPSASVPVTVCPLAAADGILPGLGEQARVTVWPRLPRIELAGEYASGDPALVGALSDAKP